MSVDTSGKIDDETQEAPKRGGGDKGKRTKKPRSRPRRTEPPKFGDVNLVLEGISFEHDDDKASWWEIYETCFIRSLKGWGELSLGLVCFGACLYLSCLGFELIGNSAQVLFGCRASRLFGGSDNSFVALMTGILTTVMFHSSGTTVGIIVSLVESHSISAKQGIYFIMGANIGTTVTSAMVSLAHIRDYTVMQRAFTAATVHDMFNMLTVAVLFPLELATGYLDHLSSALVEGAETGGRRSEPYEGPIKQLITPLSSRIIMANKKAIIAVAKEAGTCDLLYPIECDPGLEASYTSCTTGLIGCDKKTNRCPAFFRESATREQDQVSGALCFVLGYIFLFLGMAGIHLTIQKLLHGVSVKVVYTVTHCNGYIGIAIGVGITLLTQFSSILTSIVVPVAAIGAVRLEQLYPLVIGANIGTALQTVIRAMDANGTDPLRVALAHMFFNITATLLWYPLPPLRQVPQWAAGRLGRGAYIWRYFPVLYILTVFIFGPLFMIGLSECFKLGNGGIVFGSFLSLGLSATLVTLLYWCKCKGGDERFLQWMEQRTGRTISNETKADSAAHCGEP